MFHLPHNLMKSKLLVFSFALLLVGPVHGQLMHHRWPDLYRPPVRKDIHPSVYAKEGVLSMDIYSVQLKSLDFGSPESMMMSKTLKKDSFLYMQYHFDSLGRRGYFLRFNDKGDTSLYEKYTYFSNHELKAKYRWMNHEWVKMEEITRLSQEVHRYYKYKGPSSFLLIDFRPSDSVIFQVKSLYDNNEGSVDTLIYKQENDGHLITRNIWHEGKLQEADTFLWKVENFEPAFFEHIRYVSPLKKRDYYGSYRLEFPIDEEGQLVVPKGVSSKRYLLRRLNYYHRFTIFSGFAHSAPIQWEKDTTLPSETKVQVVRTFGTPEPRYYYRFIYHFQ